MPLPTIPASLILCGENGELLQWLTLSWLRPQGLENQPKLDIPSWMAYPNCTMSLAALSDRLTDAIVAVEHQRLQLVNILAHLDQQASALTRVTTVLMDATCAQGKVLSALHYVMNERHGRPQHRLQVDSTMEGLAMVQTSDAPCAPIATPCTKGTAAIVSVPSSAATVQPVADATVCTKEESWQSQRPITLAETVEADEDHETSLNWNNEQLQGVQRMEELVTRNAACSASQTFAQAASGAPSAQPPGCSPVTLPSPLPPQPQQLPPPSQSTGSSPPTATVNLFNLGNRMSRSMQVVEPDMDDVGGIEYVAHLRINGVPQVGSILIATADFVGEPVVQWYRSKRSECASQISGASALQYTLTVDDVGCVVHVECTGPYGGPKVSASVSEVRPDPVSLVELHRLGCKRGAKRELLVRLMPGDEPRTLVIKHDKLKLQRKGRAGGCVTDLKHNFADGLAVHLLNHDERGFTLVLGKGDAQSFDLAAENGSARDLIVYVLRSLLPAGTSSIGAREAAEPQSQEGEHCCGRSDCSVKQAARAQTDLQDHGARDGDFRDHLKEHAIADGSVRCRSFVSSPLYDPLRDSLGRVGGAAPGEDHEQESEDFKPAPVVSFAIKSKEQAATSMASSEDLRSFSTLCAPPPAAHSRTRGRSMAANSVRKENRENLERSLTTEANVRRGPGVDNSRLAELCVPNVKPCERAEQEDKEAEHVGDQINDQALTRGSKSIDKRSSGAVAVEPPSSCPSFQTVRCTAYPHDAYVRSPCSFCPQSLPLSSLPSLRFQASSVEQILYQSKTEDLKGEEDNERAGREKDGEAKMPEAVALDTPSVLTSKTTVAAAVQSDRQLAGSATPDHVSFLNARPAGHGTQKHGVPGMILRRPGVVFTMLAVEAIDATFDGDALRPGSCKVAGELQLLQLGVDAVPGTCHPFAFGLESTQNVSDILINRELVRHVDVANNEQSRSGVSESLSCLFHARIHACSGPEASKPLTLLRYSSAAGYAPIPLKVVARWLFGPGVERLELRVAAHPKMKAGLSDVKLSVLAGVGVDACRSDPLGLWEPRSCMLVWNIKELCAGHRPLTYRADFRTSAASEAGRGSRSLIAHFACATCNLTGLVPRPEASAPVSKVGSRFVSGRYTFHFRPSASASCDSGS